jgi:hypothetical protein
MYCGARQTTRNLTDQRLAQQNQPISPGKSVRHAGSLAVDAHKPEAAQQPGLHSAAAVGNHPARPGRIEHGFQRATRESMRITALMRERIDPHWRTVALASVLQFMLLLRWRCLRIRNGEVTRKFIEGMATSHLPHICRQLEKLRDEKGIETPPEPPIRSVNLNLLDGDGEG